MATKEGVPLAPEAIRAPVDAGYVHAGYSRPQENLLLNTYTGYAADGMSHQDFVRKVRRKAKPDSLVEAFCAWIVEHQIGLSVNLILLLTLVHLCFPRARQRTQKYFQLSYYDSQTGTYTQGYDDLAFVAFWIVVFTGLRAGIMDYILKPLARAGGIKKKKAIVRFAEQAWLFLYSSTSWTLGMYIMYNSPYWLNLREMWTNFPTRNMAGIFKWYYLVQFAFWLQQILVVNIEERRKDYAQMFTHHIITSALLLFSYGFYQAKVGNVILCIMDGVDILLPAAKLLKYLGYQTPCDITFGVFIVAWFIARHIFYMMICWSIYVDVPIVMPSGCYDTISGQRLLASSEYPSNGGTEIYKNVVHSFSEPEGVVCMNEPIRYSFLSLLLALQVITLIWFGMIVRVAYRVLSGGGADDSRSDDEGEDTEEEIEPPILPYSAANGVEYGYSGVADGKKKLEMKPKEEEVGVEGLRFVRRTSPRLGVKSGGSARKGRASGISLPGHMSGDHKELLGRIGCDKPTI